MQTSDQSWQRASWRRRAYLVIAWLMFGLVLLGFATALVGSYVPSRLGEVYILIFSFFGAVTGAVVGLRNLAGRNPVIRLLAGIVVMLAAFYCAAIGSESLSARTLGAVGDRAVTVDSWRTTSRDICGGPSFSEIHFVPVPLCLNESWRPKLPPGTKMILHGRQTALGMQISNAEIASTT